MITMFSFCSQNDKTIIKKQKRENFLPLISFLLISLYIYIKEGIIVIFTCGTVHLNSRSIGYID
jgi:hypothetical protein